MPRKRLELRESTLSRNKVRLVSPAPDEYARLTRRQLKARAQAGGRKTYRITWRVGVGRGRVVAIHREASFPIDADDGQCVEELFQRATQVEAERVNVELGLWNDVKPDARMADYLLGKASADVDAMVGEDHAAHQIRATTARDVKRYLRMVAGAVGDMTIRDCDDRLVMNRLFGDIATEHGRATAIHARSALSRYAFGPLADLGVTHGNPCLGGIALPPVKRGPGRIEHGMSLGEDTRELFVGWLRGQYDLVGDIPRWGRYSAGHRQACRMVALDIALGQATCGFRVGELRLMQCSQVEVFPHSVRVTITAEKSKTHMARRFEVWDPDCEAMLRRRVEGRAGELPVFPRPGADDGRFWDDGDLAARERRLYDQAADELGDDRLRHAAGHNWRTTIATNAKNSGQVSIEVVSALLGHDKSMDARSYTDHIDTVLAGRQMRAALGIRREGDVAEVIPFEAAKRRLGTAR